MLGIPLIMSKCKYWEWDCDILLLFLILVLDAQLAMNFDHNT